MIACRNVFPHSKPSHRAHALAPPRAELGAARGGAISSMPDRRALLAAAARHRRRPFSALRIGKRQPAKIPLHSIAADKPIIFIDNLSFMDPMPIPSPGRLCRSAVAAVFPGFCGGALLSPRSLLGPQGAGEYSSAGFVHVNCFLWNTTSRKSGFEKNIVIFYDKVLDKPHRVW